MLGLLVYCLPMFRTLKIGIEDYCSVVYYEARFILEELDFGQRQIFLI
jgi:hypothetical protein